MGALVADPEASTPSTLCVKRVEAVFVQCFLHKYNTRLAGGFDEPLYHPAQTQGQTHRLCYREDFFASALHEVSHWCIAGKARRVQTDFGYWYAPDGRSPSQQKAFENVEYKPQALEWFFAKACGHHFRISVDNLEGIGGDMQPGNAFGQRVLAQARHWCQQGLPGDAGLFFRALCQEFGEESDLGRLTFSLSELK